MHAESDRLGARPSCRELARKIQAQCLRRGLIVELGDRQSGVVRFLPPLIVTADDADRIALIFSDAVAAVVSG